MWATEGRGKDARVRRHLGDTASWCYILRNSSWNESFPDGKSHRLQRNDAEIFNRTNQILQRGKLKCPQ